MATVLVVDDSRVAQRVFSHILRQHGYDVLTASDGHDALVCLDQSPVDLVLADLRMPGLDGLGLLKAMRADDRFRHVPVVILTSFDQDSNRLVAEAEGVSAFLGKPPGSEALTQTVRRLLEVPS